MTVFIKSLTFVQQSVSLFSLVRRQTVHTRCVPARSIVLFECSIDSPDTTRGSRFRTGVCVFDVVKPDYVYTGLYNASAIVFLRLCLSGSIRTQATVNEGAMKLRVVDNYIQRSAVCFIDGSIRGMCFIISEIKSPKSCWLSLFYGFSGSIHLTPVNLVQCPGFQRIYLQNPNFHVERTNSDFLHWFYPLQS